MKYKDALIKSMNMLAEDKNTIFLGYNLNFGTKCYGTLEGISNEQRLETPLAENLMTGLCTGLALEGFRPVLFFERHDYILLALDAIVNHLGKLKEMTNGQFKAPVIIRATVGSSKPIHPGPQHIQDFSEELKKMISFPVYEPKNSQEVLDVYEKIKNIETPVLILERKELYGQDTSVSGEEKEIKQKVLVTGGAGYVGSVLVPNLLEKGYEVRVLDSMLFSSQGLDSVKDKCEIVEGDIRDYNLVEKCLEDIDFVIHLAAISNDPCSDLDPELTKQVNFEATKNLVKLSKEKKVKRFIYASSSSVYGIKQDPNVTEDLPLDPLTIYSKTKEWSEQVVRQSNDNDFTAVVLRPATVCGYSPRMRLDLTVNILTDHAINKGKITVFGGSQKRPNIHIEDITNYYIELLKIPKEKIAGETFNAGYENHTVIEIAEMIKEIIGNNVTIERTESDDLRSYHISSEKIKKMLGLAPKKTIKDAVSDLKIAFEKGLIPNPLDSNYKNIEKMKEIGIENLTE